MTTERLLACALMSPAMATPEVSVKAQLANSSCSSFVWPLSAETICRAVWSPMWLPAKESVVRDSFSERDLARRRPTSQLGQKPI